MQGEPTTHPEGGFEPLLTALHTYPPSFVALLTHAIKARGSTHLDIAHQGRPGGLQDHSRVHVGGDAVEGHRLGSGHLCACLLGQDGAVGLVQLKLACVCMHGAHLNCQGACLNVHKRA